MLEKILAVFLVFALLFSLTACSGSNDKNPTDSTNSDAAKENAAVGLWKSGAKIKISDIMNDSEGVKIPDENIGWLDVFSQIQSDVETEVYIEFKQDNSYALKYKLDDFATALKEYYKEVFKLFKQDRELFEVTYNMDFVTIETMMINSPLTSYEDIVDSFEDKMTVAIDGMSDALTITSVVPTIQDGSVEDGYVVVKGYNYAIDGKNLNLYLDSTGEKTITMSLNGDEIEFASAPENANADIFKNGLNKVK